MAVGCQLVLSAIYAGQPTRKPDTSRHKLLRIHGTTVSFFESPWWKSGPNISTSADPRRPRHCDHQPLQPLWALASTLVAWRRHKLVEHGTISESTLLGLCCMGDSDCKVLHKNRRWHDSMVAMPSQSLACFFPPGVLCSDMRDAAGARSSETMSQRWSRSSWD